jgi:hypothetical protein
MNWSYGRGNWLSQGTGADEFGRMSPHSFSLPRSLSVEESLPRLPLAAVDLLLLGGFSSKFQRPMASS